MLVDGHEDLAWNMLTFGRDYTLPAAATRARERGSATVERNGETMLGSADWRKGGVGLVFGALFASPMSYGIEAWETLAFDDGDGESAHRAYRRELTAYDELFDRHPELFAPIRSRNDLARHLTNWEASDESARRLGIVVLMEGAYGVRSPEEVGQWNEWGVRIIGPSWMTASAYAGGTREPGPLTKQGNRLLQQMSSEGLILDVSHLSEQSARQAIDAYEGQVIASHSNPRALLMHTKYPERHLSDQVIDALVKRGAVIGMVLGNSFLSNDWVSSQSRSDVTLETVVAHIDYVCQRAGHAKSVGIGSDFDGGFGRGKCPTGLESVADLPKLADPLLAKGYSTADVDAVLGDNWIRMLQQALPEG